MKLTKFLDTYFKLSFITSLALQIGYLPNTLAFFMSGFGFLIFLSYILQNLLFIGLYIYIIKKLLLKSNINLNISITFLFYLLPIFVFNLIYANFIVFGYSYNLYLILYLFIMYTIPLFAIYKTKNNLK